VPSCSIWSPAFFLPPIILAYISLEEYGIWAMCFILIGYLGMSAFGVSNVYIRYVAQYHAQGEEHRIGDLLSTGVTLVSLVGVVALGLLWVGLPTLIEALSVSPELQSTAFVLIFGSAAVFVLELSWGAFAYVLTGLQRIVQQNQVWVGTFLLETLLVVVFLIAGFGVYGLLYAFAIRYLVSISVNVLLCFRNLPGLRISLRRFNRADLALFYRYGGIVQLSGFLGMFLRSIEKLIAGLFINVQATGLFDVAQKFPVMATSIPSSMNAVFLPATSYMHTQERRGELIGLYLKGARYINLVTGFMMGFMAAFAAPLMVAWLGPNPELRHGPVDPGLLHAALPAQRPHRSGLEHLSRHGHPGTRADLPAVPACTGDHPGRRRLPDVRYRCGGDHRGGCPGHDPECADLHGLYQWFPGAGSVPFHARRLAAGSLALSDRIRALSAGSPWVGSVGDDRWGSVLLVLVAGIAYCALQAALLWLLQLDAGEKDYVAGKVRGLVGRFGGTRRQRKRAFE
jgi:hypothetical protein